MREFSPEETPIDIGSLEREAFADLGDWSLIKDKEGYGIIYRIGTKDVKDDRGKDTLLVLYFAKPVAKPGLLITKEISDRKYEDFSETMKQVTYKLALKSDKNVMTIASQLPDWMISELESILKKK
jgi:hypothetical protein